jgi:hypothetical protein
LVRSSSLTLLASALVLVTGAAAAGGGMTVTSSSHAAGAHGIRVTAVLRYEMQCGYPGVAPVQLRWPGAVPAHLARTAVLVNGKPTRSVSVDGHRVSVGMPPRPQIMCDVIGPGKLTIVLAGVANPSAAGSHVVVATKGPMHFSASFATH